MASTTASRTTRRTAAVGRRAACTRTAGARPRRRPARSRPTDSSSSGPTELSAVAGRTRAAGAPHGVRRIGCGSSFAPCTGRPSGSFARIARAARRAVPGSASRGPLPYSAAPAVARPRRGPRPARMTHITVVNGPASGTQVALIRGETCTIGSAPDCTIRIELPGIAAVQAEIKALRAEGFGIKRAGGPISVNGTSVEAARLAEGDVIDVGSVQLLYGPPSLASRRAEKGRILGGFRLLDTLGKGGMGTVYRAEQVSLHRQGALKVLDEGLTRDPVFVARFVAEARAAARLHHPNVVQVYDVGHEGATYYYSMGLMTGSIEKRLKAEGRL